MGRVKNLLGGVSGKVGNLVFYESNGVSYVRTKPSRYRDANTESQQLARGRLTGCNWFYKALDDGFLRQVWKTAAKGTGKNGRNLFMKSNMHAFNKNGSIADHSRVHFSAGDLPLPSALRLVGENKRDYTIQWANDPKNIYGSPHDRVFVVMISGGFQITLLIEGTVNRSEGKASFTVDTPNPKDTHIYVFFGTNDLTGFSETRHLTSV